MNLHLKSTIFAICLLFVADVVWAQTANYPELSGYQQERQITGLALAEQSAEVATIVSQRMVEVHVNEGQAVSKGQLLATLEYSVALAEFQAASAIANDESSVNVARIDARESRDRVLRFQTAVQNGAGNEMELEIAQNEFNKAMALLEREKSRLISAAKSAETAKARQEAYFIRAPFDGIVTEQHVHVGNMVQNGDVIFSIVAPSRLRAELNLPLELFGKLKQGENYDIQAGVPVQRTLQARLKFVSPTIDSASQTFRCIFEIDNKDNSLPAGFPVQLTQSQFNDASQGAGGQFSMSR